MNVTLLQKDGAKPAMISPSQKTRKEGTDMKIKLNPDQEVVNTIREGLKRTGGY